MLGIPHPYLTPALPGIGGTIKSQPDDFLVAEVPLYVPCGRGEHTYFEIEKVDLSTPEAIERLRRVLGVEGRDFGYAGLKDRKGITRQTMSIAGIEPEKLLRLDVPQIRILWAKLHKNKLRIGHLKGNRFRVRIRGVCPGARDRAERILGVILEQGIPNYFGPQRFGNRGDAHWVGRDFLKRDARAAIRRILGHPSATEQNPNVVRARELFMAGDFRGALAAFPSAYREERRLLAYFLKAGENYAGAKRHLGQAPKKLYHTAYQSYIFNVALAERMERTGRALGTLFEGDIACLHQNGAVFRVVDPAAEAARASAFEISPTGPIFGKKMPQPGGVEAEIEAGILGREGLLATDFHQLMPRLHLEGGRRPFRVRPGDVHLELDGSDLCLQFFLPKGSYGTTLLREIMKNDVVPDAFYAGGEEAKHRLWRPGPAA
jgi:tRNA pseudouridine13 synthase